MTSPTIEAVQRALALLHGPQRQVIDLLADGQQPTVESTGLDPDALAHTLGELSSTRLVTAVDRADGQPEVALTEKGRKIAQLAKELDAGSAAPAQPIV